MKTVSLVSKFFCFDKFMVIDIRLIDYCLTSSEQYISYIQGENKFNSM